MQPLLSKEKNEKELLEKLESERKKVIDTAARQKSLESLVENSKILYEKIRKVGAR